jgi:hypothetical protein
VLIPKQITTLLALLNVPQSHHLLEILSRVFLLLATCKRFVLHHKPRSNIFTDPSIHEQLSTSPEDGSHREDLDYRDSSLVHQLCVFLLENFNGNFTQASFSSFRLDLSLTPDKTSVTRSNLLGCLAQLSLTQGERLVHSPIVIPTLVYLIAQLAMLLWNDDECGLLGLAASS